MSKITDIKATLNSVFESILQTNRLETEATYGDVIRTIVSEHQSAFDDMETFELFGNSKIDDVLEGCLRVIYPNITENAVSDLYFLYRHYNYVETHLQNFLEQCEGSMGCADKSRWILKVYKEFILTQQLPDMTREESCYWKPKRGESVDWFDLCKSLRNFYLGYSKDYLSAMSKLVYIYKKVN